MYVTSFVPDRSLRPEGVSTNKLLEVIGLIAKELYDDVVSSVHPVQYTICVKIKHNFTSF